MLPQNSSANCRPQNFPKMEGCALSRPIRERGHDGACPSRARYFGDFSANGEVMCRLTMAPGAGGDKRGNLESARQTAHPKMRFDAGDGCDMTTPFTCGLTRALAVCLLSVKSVRSAAMSDQEPTTSPSSDAELVLRLKQRDPEAMEALVRAHGAKLFGVACQFLRDETAAQDVVQEALLSVWNKIGSFEGRSSLTSWLYRVTANAALMRLRKEKRHQMDISIDSDKEDAAYRPLQLEDTRPLPSGALQGDELKAQIQAAIDRLPEPYRSVVLLKDVEEFSLEEIAELTHASIAAVKSRLHRARLTLRETLLPYLQARVEER
jgi:RNA polymerase sigma-70 factor (ECF subfamily)